MLDFIKINPVLLALLLYCANIKSHEIWNHGFMYQLVVDVGGYGNCKDVNKNVCQVMLVEMLFVCLYINSKRLYMSTFVWILDIPLYYTSTGKAVI